MFQTQVRTPSRTSIMSHDLSHGLTRNTFELYKKELNWKIFDNFSTYFALLKTYFLHDNKILTNKILSNVVCFAICKNSLIIIIIAQAKITTLLHKIVLAKLPWIWIILILYLLLSRTYGTLFQATEYYEGMLGPRPIQLIRPKSQQNLHKLQRCMGRVIYGNADLISVLATYWKDLNEMQKSKTSQRLFSLEFISFQRWTIT